MCFIVGLRRFFCCLNTIKPLSQEVPVLSFSISARHTCTCRLLLLIVLMMCSLIVQVHHSSSIRIRSNPIFFLLFSSFLLWLFVPTTILQVSLSLLSIKQSDDMRPLLIISVHSTLPRPQADSIGSRQAFYFFPLTVSLTVLDMEFMRSWIFSRPSCMYCKVFLYWRSWDWKDSCVMARAPAPRTAKPPMIVRVCIIEGTD